jgi:phosphohistidine phosphatase SixA
MKTLILLRHADVDVVPEPELNARGRERADALAELLAVAGVTSIFVSPALRTQQTAAPLAAKVGLVAQIVSTSQQTVTKALSTVAGEVVVVIGHSNTIPEMLHTLGDPMPATAILQGHEDLFIATVLGPNSVRVVHLKYGN